MYKCDENFRMQYVNCFDRLRFFAEVRTNFEKMHCFGQSKEHKSGRKLEN